MGRHSIIISNRYGTRNYNRQQRIAYDELGILDKIGVLHFRGTPIGSSTPPTPPDPPTPPEPVESDLWIPPTQASSSRNKYTYRSFIEAYDALMSAHPTYIKKFEYQEQQTGTRTIYDSSYKRAHTNVPTYSQSRQQVAAGAYNSASGVGYGGFPLYHYEFTPANYTKTFYVQACIHGNEHDAPQTLLRIMDIICNHTDETAYARLKPLRDNVRWIIVPVVSFCTSKTRPAAVDQMFDCYNTTVTVHTTEALSEDD